MEKPFPAYTGEEAYVFVCYAHEDSDDVYPEIRWLQDQGVNVWWDDGIKPGSEWSDALADAIEGCAHFVYFITPRSVATENCRRELNHAIAENRELLTVFLEETDVPGGIRLHLHNRQAILKHKLEPDAYRQKLHQALGQAIKAESIPEMTPATIIPRRTLRGPSVVIILLLAGLGVIAGGGWWWRTSIQVNWAYETALPEIMRLADAGEYVTAHSLSQEAEPYIASNPLFQNQWGRITNEISIRTDPAGAEVSYKEYDDIDGPWNNIGITPLEDIRLPRGAFRWRIEKSGYEVREIAARVIDPSTKKMIETAGVEWDTIHLTLARSEDVPTEMLSVEGREQEAYTIGPIPKLALESFLIDRTEVTNAAFKAFVDAGGYARPEFWSEPFVKDGVELTFEEAMIAFRDATDRPGPATWSMSGYPSGTDDHPVGGVSWYEAAAYARFRGKALPTIYHWQRAALPDNDETETLTPLIIAQSNFAGQGPTPVGTSPGISQAGAYDMAGNVSEWVWTAGSGDSRYVVGGDWLGRTEEFIAGPTSTASSWQRLPTNGFRCATYASGTIPEALLRALKQPAVPDYRALPPRPDDVFAAEARYRTYDPTPLNAVVESSEPSVFGGRQERVTLDAGYANERLMVDLHLPSADTAKQPFQAVLWVGAGTRGIMPKAREEAFLDATDFFVQSGRVLVNPILAGTYERKVGDNVRMRMQLPTERRELFVQWTKDIARTIDYLETREDIDADRIAFVALSRGASQSLNILPYEQRFRVGIFWAAGFIRGVPESPVERADLVRRIRLPMLMLNGRLDAWLAIETQVKPLFDLLGASEEDKRLMVYETSHWPYPHNEVIKESLAWLDRYLGPVEDPG